MTIRRAGSTLTGSSTFSSSTTSSCEDAIAFHTASHNSFLRPSWEDPSEERTEISCSGFKGQYSTSKFSLAGLVMSTNLRGMTIASAGRLLGALSPPSSQQSPMQMSTESSHSSAGTTPSVSSDIEASVAISACCFMISSSFERNSSGFAPPFLNKLFQEPWSSKSVTGTTTLDSSLGERGEDPT